MFSRNATRAGSTSGARTWNERIAAAAMAAACGMAIAAVCGATTSAWADTSLTRPLDGSSSKLSDAAATDETKTVYNFIKSRTSKLHSNMIVGQHMGGPGDLAQTSVAFDMTNYRIESATPGRHAYPRLIGARYDALADGVYRLEAGLIDQINARLIEASDIYHPIVSITATPRNPWAPQAGRSFVSGQGKLAELARANRGAGPAKKFWDDIDLIADGLAKLKTADGKAIPVLFRPFAEVNTSDKYYYRQQEAAQFVALWRDVADYYVNTRKLHNLMFTWEAWVWGRVGFGTENIAPWFPAKRSETDNPWVDVVSGAFYFDAVDPRFSLQFSPDTNDQKVFYDLMNLARTADKPFGAAQFSVTYPKQGEACTQGDNRNALLFMKSIDDRHYVAAPTTQHLSFVYYWADDNRDYCMAVNRQKNSTEFVDDHRVATVTGIDAINNESGSIIESGRGTGVGGDVSPGWPLRTGDEWRNRQVKAIASFDTSTALLPADAVLGDAPASLVLRKNVMPYDQFPGGLSDLGIEAANQLGASTQLTAADFNAPAAKLPGKISPPTASFKGEVSWGPVPTANVNRSGRTQLRLAFGKATDGNGGNNFIEWTGQVTPGPELIFSFTRPNNPQ